MFSQPFISRVGFALLLVPVLAIGGFALRLVTGDPALVPYELRINLEQNRIPFILHTSFGGIAMLVGIWQFSAWLRNRHSALHRWMGRAYVFCCLIAGLAAYPIAFGTSGGPWAAAGFAVMATLWLGATFYAYRAIRRGRVAAHRHWMVRSYALTLSAVTLRALLLIPIFWPVDFTWFYAFSAWASWIVNALLAELWLRFARKRAGQLDGAVQAT